jgi:hypothetical protein
MAPETGSQRTIERPDSVSRVMPPTTIITRTSAATASSQFETGFGRGRGKGAAAMVAMDRHIARFGANSSATFSDM